MSEICKVQKAPIHVFYSEDQKLGDMGIGEYAIYKSVLYVLDHRNQITNDDTIVKAIAQNNLVPLVVGDIVKTIFDNNSQNMLNLREGIEQRVINSINDLSALKDMLAAQAGGALDAKIQELNSKIDNAVNNSNTALTDLLSAVEQAKTSAIQAIDDKTRVIDEYKLPIGSIIAMSSDYIPAGYLLCNGAAVNRQNYSLLFAKIGTTYGEGDGTNTFNLPDLRGKFVRGLGGNSDLLGKTQGDAIRNIQGEVDICHGDNNVTNGVFRDNGRKSRGRDGNGWYSHSVIFDASTVVPTANENRPLNMAMNYLIKASGSDAQNASLEEIRLDGIPIGGYLDYASDAVLPAGFMVADGRSLNKNEYPDLFQIIKYTYGGSEDNFNLPDFSDGKFARATGGNADRLGVKQGDATRQIKFKFVMQGWNQNMDSRLFSYEGNWAGFDKNSVAMTNLGNHTWATFDNAGVVPVAAEVRPLNMSVVKLIKVKNVSAKNNQIVYEYVNNKPLGVDQKWVDFKWGVDRKWGTVYTNDTGRPILVSACYTYSGSHGLNIYVDDILVAGGVGGKQIVVPAGSKYKVTYNGGGTYPVNWSELR